jgi:hypothetical protein
MTAWEKEVYKLDVNRALLRYDIDVMIVTCYSTSFLQKMQITLLTIEYNISVYRKIQPKHIKEVSHLLMPIDEAMFQ